MHDDDEWKKKCAFVGVWILLFYTVLQAVKIAVETIVKNP